MKPPDYCHIPNKLLKAAELACKKYLASSEAIPEVVETVTDLLMGSNWPECDFLEDLRRLSLFYKGLYYLLPTTVEIKEKNMQESYKYFATAYDSFHSYLNEPS